MMGTAETKAAIVAAFKEGDQLLTAQIAQRVGMSAVYVSKVLLRMMAETYCPIKRVRTGKPGSHGGALEFVYYRACDPEPLGRKEFAAAKRTRVANAPKVAAPYPRVLLNVAPADMEIGRAMRSHAALAMEIRR